MNPREVIKARMPGLAGQIRRAGRFRFLLKARRVREEGARFRDDPVNVARFVLLDPETHSYSYELANVDELVEFVGGLVNDVPPERLRAYAAEALQDRELGVELSRRVRWRIEYKRRLPLGNRLLWYVLARAVKPELTVETGIHDGLGSLMLLRALERNTEDGVEGRLISIDFDPASGWLVPSQLRGRWTPIFEDIETALERSLQGEKVDLFIHESDHNEELQRIEFGAALAHPAPVLWIIDSSGLELEVLREICEERGVAHHYFLERPARHFYKPPGTSVAVFDEPAG